MTASAAFYAQGAETVCHPWNCDAASPLQAFRHCSCKEGSAFAFTCCGPGFETNDNVHSPLNQPPPSTRLLVKSLKLCKHSYIPLKWHIFMSRSICSFNSFDVCGLSHIHDVLRISNVIFGVLQQQLECLIIKRLKMVRQAQTDK